MPKEIQNRLFFMLKALKEAKAAFKKREVPVGCVIVSKGRVISKAHNTRDADGDPLAHAEIKAIEKACRKTGDFRLNDCEIYVTLEPCLMCLGAILQSRIKKLVFGSGNPREGAVSLLPAIRKRLDLKYKIKVERGVLEKESRLLLKSFFKRLRGSNK